MSCIQPLRLWLDMDARYHWKQKNNYYDLRLHSSRVQGLDHKGQLPGDLRAEGVSFAKIGNIRKVNRDTVRRYYHTFLEEKK